ncbi:solute carrier family 22 member 11 isoform X6 [Heterocephalus glaber]|uniref:Solute carrier family 22 member 11 isoform X6 n=1 Tax=Heterocephalus glaber TaxID=10181 RepID=A0AAX6QXT8_HETGA|nr:solute carrier family 22 member 11 isoform X6 [Heterocephalus glaber]
MAFEELLERAGGMGLFQVLQVATLLLPTIFTPFHMLLENFSAAIPDHRCWTHMLDNGSETSANLTYEALLAVSIPPGPDQQPHPCRRFRQPQWQLLDPNTTAANWSEAATEPCVDGWVYDHSTFTATVVTKWNLVCDSQGLKPMGQSIYMAGILVGSFIWGLLSYRLGRKPMLSWCCLQVAVAGTGTTFAPNFLIYCGLRFLSAFGLAGIILVLSTLIAEWTTTRRRAVTMMILGCTYSTGQMAVAGLAFILRDWQDLQLATSMPLLAFSLVSWSVRFGASSRRWLPESARWLIITGQPDRALQELKKVARINGHKEARKTLTIEVLMSSMKEEAVSARAHTSVLDLIRMPALRRRICTMLVVKSAELASGFCCPGERMLWNQPDLPHHLQDRALPHSTADDRRRLLAVSRPPGGNDGPPDQDGPPGPALAASAVLRYHPCGFQPGSPALPPRDPGSSTS